MQWQINVELVLVCFSQKPCLSPQTQWYYIQIRCKILNNEMKHENQWCPMPLKVKLMNELMIWLSNLQKLAGTSLRGGVMRCTCQLSLAALAHACQWKRHACLPFKVIWVLIESLQLTEKISSSFFQVFQDGLCCQEKLRECVSRGRQPEAALTPNGTRMQKSAAEIWSNHDLSAAAVALIAIPLRRAKLVRTRRRGGKAKGSCQTFRFLFLSHKQWTQRRKTIRC